MQKESIAEKLARIKREKALAANAVQGLTGEATGEASRVGSCEAQAEQPAVSPEVLQSTEQATPPAPAEKLTVAQMMAKLREAKAQVAKEAEANPAPKATAQTVSAKLRELPVGKAEVEAAHPDLCEATRNLCLHLEEANEGILHWLDRCHEQLRMNPELIHILTDEQTSVLYQAAIRKSGIKIVPEKAKASKAKGSGKVQATLEEM